MPLRIDDGYTLEGETTGKGDQGEPLPVVKFEYRPPLAREMADYRYQVQTAQSGDGVLRARVEFLVGRLVGWDVYGRDNKPVKIDADVLRRVPDPILLDLVNECSKWKPRPEAEALGNS